MSYYSPTPIKWRKIGDAILGLGTALQVALASFQASDITHLAPKEYFYWVIAVAVLMAAGKYLTNFAVEKEG